MNYVIYRLKKMTENGRRCVCLASIYWSLGMEQELKKEWLTRPGRLIIRYALSAKAQDAQWTYVGRYDRFHRFVSN